MESKTTWEMFCESFQYVIRTYLGLAVAILLGVVVVFGTSVSMDRIGASWFEACVDASSGCSDAEYEKIISEIFAIYFGVGIVFFFGLFWETGRIAKTSAWSALFVLVLFTGAAGWLTFGYIDLAAPYGPNITNSTILASIFLLGIFIWAWGTTIKALVNMWKGKGDLGNPFSLLA